MVHPEPKIPFQGNSGAAGWGRSSRVNFESRMRDALGGIKPTPTWGIQKGLHKLLGIIVTSSIPSHPFRQFKSTKYVSRMDTYIWNYDHNQQSTSPRDGVLSLKL